MPAYLKNEAGKRYGRLLVLSRADHARSGYTRWLCRCDCGKETKTSGLQLRRGTATSCGCLAKDKLRLAAANSALPPHAASERYLFRVMKRNAEKVRGIGWCLSESVWQRLVGEPCYYCGVVRSNRYTHTPAFNGGAYSYNGIDRLDPAGDYVEGNVVACCKACNVAKASMSTGEFLSWVRRIYERQCNARHVLDYFDASREITGEVSALHAEMFVQSYGSGATDVLPTVRQVWPKQSAGQA